MLLRAGARQGGPASAGLSGEVADKDGCGDDDVRDQREQQQHPMSWWARVSRLRT